jgi:pimeloyl-ACP methyl ester carboxylesterase
VTVDRDEDGTYDEFSMLRVYAEHEGIRWEGPPVVRRQAVVVEGRRVSALLWGAESPDVVLVHSRGQNAHTWDSVAMALDRPVLAIDLPGHGHSDWRDDHDYGPWRNATSLAVVIDQLAPDARAVVGFAFGGLTTICLAEDRPDQVRRLIVVGVTPAVRERSAALRTDQRGSTVLLSGPSSYESFEAMLEAVAATARHRPIESLRPGLLHNAYRQPDGRWAWRYDREFQPSTTQGDLGTKLWDAVAGLTMPIMLVRGSESAFVHHDDVERFRSVQPHVRTEVVEGAGHPVQSDRPVVLARLISDFVETSGHSTP